MNVHHLELYYYVARFGGISEAVRNIPYGIQQPAVSSQVIQLEDDLGVTLFQRRPFALTPAGEELFDFIKPFFGGLDSIAEKLRGGSSQQVRIGAAEVILREHLPEILQVIGQKHPKLRVVLREGYHNELETWLEKRELDLIVTILDGKSAPGTQMIPLLQLPLALLVGKSCRIRSVDELWKRDRIEETLITLPPKEAITKAFRKGLDRADIDWFTGIEVSSLALIQTYVANGFGIGVSVLAPQSKFPKGVRCLPLPDFPTVTVGVVWSGKPTPLMQDLANEMKQRVEKLKR